MKKEDHSFLRSIKKLKVLVIGDLIMDAYFYGACSRIAPEASVPVIDIQRKSYCLGGAANAAANLAALGCKVTLCTVIGADEVGKQTKTMLADLGIDTQHLILDNHRKTLLKTRVVSPSQLLLRYDEGDAAPITAVTAKNFVSQLELAYQDCDLVLIADYHKGVIGAAVISSLSSLLQEQPKFLAVDSKRLHSFSALSPSLVKPNYEEAMQLLGLTPDYNTNRVQQLTTLGRRLFEKTNAKQIVLTLDNEGGICFENGHYQADFAAPKVSGNHTSGAGDTFLAVYMLASYLNMSLEETAHLACKAAGLVIDKQDTAICTAAELELALFADDKLVKSKVQMRKRCELLKTQGKKIVFTNGCFDVLHSGHVDYLQKAKSLGDILIVGVNNDESVKRLKGQERPINHLAHRMEVLKALACVDYVISFGSSGNDTPTSVLQYVLPDIFAKGGDYKYKDLPERRLLKRMGAEIVFLPYVNGQSSTRLIKRMANGVKLAAAN